MHALNCMQKKNGERFKSRDFRSSLIKTWAFLEPFGFCVKTENTKRFLHLHKFVSARLWRNFSVATTTWLRRVSIVDGQKLPMTIFFSSEHVVFGCCDRRWWALWRCARRPFALASRAFYSTQFMLNQSNATFFPPTMLHDTKRWSRFRSMFNIREHLNLQRRRLSLTTC